MKQLQGPVFVTGPTPALVDDPNAVWTCEVCGRRNELSESDEDDVATCKCCGRQQHPPWLLLLKTNTQIGLGSRMVITHDEPEAVNHIGVVIGIDYLKRHIEILSVAYRASYRATGHTHGQRELTSAGGRKSKFRFEIVEMDGDQIQCFLTPLTAESIVDHQELYDNLRQQGICGDCRRIFRISRGDRSAEYDSREAVQDKQHEIRLCSERKATHIKLKQFDRVVECTNALHQHTLQLSQLKRKLEFLDTISCPHCGWSTKP